MGLTYTNKTDISLALAVWLVDDNYDYQPESSYISATGLMKPLRQIILTPRVRQQRITPDIEDLIPSAMGHSLHDSIERAWTTNHVKNLAKLRIPQGTIDRIRVNPSDDEVRGSNSIIPVYLEQRVFRTLEGMSIGGKYDMVTDGMLQDAKSTSAYTWLFGGKDDDYRLQMSIYRWLDAAQPLPKITEDVGRINFIFTDWQRLQARSNPRYPQSRIERKDLQLMSLKETENWVRDKLRLIQGHVNTPEALLPECTDEELWRSDPTYKYYADPTKTAGKSSKNFTTLHDANQHKAEKGKGIVKAVPGEPKRCNYCEAFAICTQKDRYFRAPE